MAFFGGVPRIIVPDNLKSAVVKAAFTTGEEPHLHRKLLRDRAPLRVHHRPGAAQRPGVFGDPLLARAAADEPGTDEDVDGGDETGEPPPPPSGSYRHKTHIYTAPLFWGYADHSAVKVNSCRSTSPPTMDVTRPTSSMSLSCYENFRGRSNATPVLWDNVCDSYSGSGVTSGTHVCNDDTYAEYGNVHDNYIVGAWSTCTDSSLRKSAPTCW